MPDMKYRRLALPPRPDDDGIAQYCPGRHRQKTRAAYCLTAPVSNGVQRVRMCCAKHLAATLDTMPWGEAVTVQRGLLWAAEEVDVKF